MPRLTAKGQITVPVAIRYALDLGPGDRVVFRLEEGRSVLRKATPLDDLAGSIAVAPRAGAHALERLFVEGDETFALELETHRRRGTRLRMPDAVLLGVAAQLVDRGAARAVVSDALRDVLAERVIRVDHPTAVRAAIDELAAGGDPLRAYALARG